MFAGLAACVLDFMTALLNIMVLGNVECEDDEACQSVVAYVFAFFLYLVFHGYLSYAISQRASLVHKMLNPVTSGIIRL